MSSLKDCRIYIFSREYIYINVREDIGIRRDLLYVTKYREDRQQGEDRHLQRIYNNKNTERKP